MMARLKSGTAAIATLMLLGACADFDREQGAVIDGGQFGNATMHNTLIQQGEGEYAIMLAQRFNREVPDTVTFAFNSAELSPEAKAVLARQANFIRQFPEVRFKVFGHTDLVGGQSYNKALGLRRAQTVVNFLVANGAPRARLQAVVSHGKNRPVIQTSQPEQRNRRTVTEVSGFVRSNPMVMDGKYAEVVRRNYIELAARSHPQNSTIAQTLNPSQ